MRNFKAVLRILLVLTALALPYVAEAAYGPYDGGLPGEALSFAAGARSMGMGRAFTAVADDATSAYWNPAGLARLPRYAATGLFATLGDKAGGSFSFLGFAAPVSDSFGAAFGLVNLQSANYAGKTADNVATGETFGVAQRGFYGAAAYKVLDDLAVGLTIKGAQEQVAGKSGVGFGLDAGAQYEPLLHLRLGLSILGIVPPQPTVGRATDDFPPSARLGVAYALLEHKLMLAADVDLTRSRGVKARAGAEFRPLPFVAVRAGINESELTLGLGGTYAVGPGDGSLDYAMALNEVGDPIGIVHRLSLSFAFGRSRGKPELYAWIGQALFSPHAVIKRNRAIFDVHAYDPAGFRSWKISIFMRDQRGVKEVHEQNGAGAPPSRVEWNGKTDDGQVVSEGIYYFTVEAVNQDGNAAVTEDQAFRVFPKPPEVKID